MDLEKLKKCNSIAVFVYGHHKDGKLFLLCAKRAGKNPKFHGGEFNVPTGKVEKFDNNPLESAIREVKEETGIDITPDMIKVANFEEYGRNGEYLGANLKVVLPDNIGDYKIGNGDWENKKYNWLPFDPENPDLLKGKRRKWFYGQDKTAGDVYKSVDESIYNKMPYKMKNSVRLSEGQLRNIIKESVYRILNEEHGDMLLPSRDENGKPTSGMSGKVDPEFFKKWLEYRIDNGWPIEPEDWQKYNDMVNGHIDGPIITDEEEEGEY